jgi:hypothetical protein
MVKKSGQIAIEFLLLMTLSLFFLAAILIILGDLSSKNMDVAREKTLTDLGLSIRNELTLASEMEDGYYREINLPKKANGKVYNISLEEGISGISYLVLTCGSYESYYSIPEITGTIQPGTNLITKNKNTTITYIS